MEQGGAKDYGEESETDPGGAGSFLSFYFVGQGMSYMQSPVC